ncbi:uncharacterized protein LOC103703269 [Phoenix dactylifera]|uniref:Uncharacterized protein LOC103703269 n=1 Tax=Phoenix dactylifera TaxID=42345 RepID=A0A8B9AVL7_PHODC|nr:uncharacterized protein LOC103703269 [Phoenix dactylifera]
MHKRKRENLITIFYMNRAIAPGVLDSDLFGLQTLPATCYAYDSYMGLNYVNDSQSWRYYLGWSRLVTRRGIMRFGKDAAETPSAKIERIDFQMEQRIDRKMLVLVKLE